MNLTDSPLSFYLFEKFWDVEEVKKRLVFTNHTPEEAGNPKTNIHLLERMGYFNNLSSILIQKIIHKPGLVFDHTRAALHFARISSGVSQKTGT